MLFCSPTDPPPEPPFEPVRAVSVVADAVAPPPPPYTFVVVPEITTCEFPPFPPRVSVVADPIPPAPTLIETVAPGVRAVPV